MIREEDRDGAVLKIFDTEYEQAQLLGVLGGDVSAVRSATGAGLWTLHLYTQSRWP